MQVAFHGKPLNLCPVAVKIKTAIEQLNACANKDTADYRIAKGLLIEACQYVKLHNMSQAENLYNAALPYLRFAELAQC